MANDNVAVQEKEVLVPELGAKQAKPMLWKQNETFLPQQPVQEQNESFQQSANDHEAHKSWKPVDYFNKYINDDVYEMLADATNQTAVLQNGHSLKTSPDEIKKFIGKNVVMGSLRYPRIRMYWKKSTGWQQLRKQCRVRDFLNFDPI